MSPAEDASLGERVLGDLLDRSHILRPDELPDLVRETARRLGADDAVIYVVDRDQRVLVALEDPSTVIDIDGTIAGRAYRTRADLESVDGRWVPMLDGSDRVGVLRIVHGAGTDDVFNARIRWLASIVALLVVTKAHFGDAIELAKRRQRMGVAAELRWALLPPLTYRNDHVEIAAMLEPVYEVAGDAFDYAVNGDMTHVALFDAMGHGIEASRMANLAVATYRNERRAGSDIRLTAARIDEVLHDQFGADRFVTALLLTLDMRTGEVEVVLCGHPRPLHLRGTNVLGPVPTKITVPLGLGVEPVVNRIDLEVGDRLLLFTDGVVEARAGDGTEFGVDRLADFVARAVMAAEIPSETARRLTHDVMAHAERLRDDATLVLLGWPAAMPAQ